MNSGGVPITLVLVDDSEVVRAGLRALLSADPAIRILGEAGTVAAGLAAVTRHQPQVVLLDIRLPDGNGIAACRQLLQAVPDTRVLFLTSTDGDEAVDDAIRAGASGYLLKEIDGRGLLRAIHEVAAGRSILDPAITSRVLQLVRGTGAPRSALEALSAQEKRVLALIAEGRTNKEAGAQLNLSEKTVKNYLSTIFEKLHVSRRAEAAVIYSREAHKG